MTRVQFIHSRLTGRGLVRIREVLTTASLLVLISTVAVGQETVDPAVAEPYNAGLNAANLADFKTAAEKFEAAIAVAPDFVDAHYNLGLVYQNLADYGKAEACFQKTLALDPGNKTAPRLLAEALSRQGKFESAIPAYEKAIAVDSTRVQLYYYMADAVGKAYPADSDKIVAAYSKALEKGPKEPGAYNAAVAIGSTCNRAKNYQGALAGYRKAAAIKSDSPTPHYNCAIVLKKMKNHNGAIKSLEKAISLKNPYGQAEFVLAGIYYDLKNDEKALEHFEKAAADPSFKKRAKAEESAASIRDYLEKKRLRDEQMEAYGGDK